MKARTGLLILETFISGLSEVTDLKVLQSVTVNNTHFNQSISWNKVTSDNHHISHYIIKYGLSSDVNSYDSEGVNITTSATNSTTLTLPLPTSLTTYNVWVAAVSNETGTGEYSEELEINYTGNVCVHMYIFRLTYSEVTCDGHTHKTCLMNYIFKTLSTKGLPDKYAHICFYVCSTWEANEPHCVQ